MCRSEGSLFEANALDKGLFFRRFSLLFIEETAFGQIHIIALDKGSQDIPPINWENRLSTYICAAQKGLFFADSP